MVYDAMVIALAVVASAATTMASAAMYFTAMGSISMVMASSSALGLAA